MSINVNIEVDRIEVSFPYALNLIFKDFFKTAKWSSSARAWVLKNTTLNKNKIEKFKEAANGTARVIKEVEEAELKVKDIERMNAVVEQLRREADRSLKKYNEFLGVNLSLDSVKEIHKVAIASAREAAEKANLAGRETKAKIDEILNLYGARALVDRLLEISRYGRLAVNRKKFEAVQAQLSDAYYKIRREQFVEIETLYELYRINWNRPDRDSPAEIVKELYTNVKVLKGDEENDAEASPAA